MRRFLGILALSLFASGCGMAANTSGADFGATPGGVQDLSFARELVKKGNVPPADSVLVEAMFSEHDLPLTGAPCVETLCVRGAVGVAPNRDGASAAWAQVGLSSTIDPDTYARPPLAVVATVDVSGSMGWGYGEDGTPGTIARKLLHEIAGQLDAGDRFSLVTYGSSSHTALDWTTGDDPEISQAIDDLSEDGSTNMEAGLEEAFARAEEMVAEGREVRVLLFTDTQPNVGATTSSEFETMVAAAAQEKIGVSVLGLGLGMGADVLKGMSHLRGGNAFSVMKPEDVPTFMSDNWPWFTVPIAYDLHLSSTPLSSSLGVTASYGFPESASGPASGLDVSTVFLSKRRGALLLELGRSDASPFVSGDGLRLSLSYADPQGKPHQASLSPAFGGAPLDARGVSMPQVGIARTVALAVFTSELKEALTAYTQDSAKAVATLEAALERLSADAASDAELTAEAEFWPALLTLMQAGAPQGDMYGGF
jgi:Ca-activated chloride channel family protein